MSCNASVVEVEQNCAPVDGSEAEYFTSLDLDLNSPRSVEACTRCGVDEKFFTAQPEDLFGRHRAKRGRVKAQGVKEDPATTSIYAERSEINRHRLLREVRRERAKLIKECHDERKRLGEQCQLSSSSAPATSPKQARSHDPSHDTGNGGRMSAPAPTQTINGTARKSPRSRNPVLEEEAQRLVTLKRRQAMELQQMLAFELRSLAREERDRRRVEKSTAREEAAEARRAERLRAAEQARIDRERFSLDREKQLEQEAANERWRQEEAARRLEAADELRRRQAARAAQRRAEDAKQKAAIFQSRIARGARVRRARELRNERDAAKRAAEREAAVESAKRAREAEAEARKTAAVARGEAARAAVEEARRRQDDNENALRAVTEEKVAELEARAESFRRRQKDIWERERVLHEEELAELAQQRHKAAQRKMDQEARRREAEIQDKARKERQMVLAMQVRKEKEAAKRQEQKRDKEAQMKRALDRRKHAEQQRQEATIRKLEEEAAKVELLRHEKERLKLARNKMCGETAKQRESLKEHFGALRGQLNGCVSFDTIVEAVATAAQSTDEDPSGNKKSQQNGIIRRPGSSKKTRGSGDGSSSPRVRASKQADAANGVSSKNANSLGIQRHRKARPISRAGGTRRVKRGSTLIVGEGGENPESGLRVPHPPAASSTSRKPPPADFGSNPGLTPQQVSSTARRQNTWLRGHEASFGHTAEGELQHGDGDHGSAARSKPSAWNSVSKKITDPFADLRQRYSNAGSSSRIFTKSVGKRSGNDAGGDRVKSVVGRQEGSRSGRKQSRGRTLSKKGSNGPSPPRKITDNIGELSGEEAMVDPSAGSKPVEQDEVFVEGCKERLCSLDGGDLSGERLRGRYDRELLAILEEEQAAEGARERTLAEARARARLAEARARAAASSNVKLTNSFSSLPNNAWIEASGWGTNNVTNRREDDSSTGLPINKEMIDEVEREADMAAREAKELEEQLARERRAASERVMRVSEAYEDALRVLAQPHRVQTQQEPP